MDYTTEEIGRVLGSQIYVYNSPDEIPALPPKGVNDVFIDINLGKLYQWDGTEWKYKFPIPNDSRIATIVDELTALGARLDDAESARVVAENGRVTAEQSRATAETARESAESTRKANETARQNAESERESAETSRSDAESLREEAEDARQTAEGNRAIAERARAEAEANRASAESSRATAESGRVSSEQARASAESARVVSEGQRATAETARANAEGARASAEATRQANESTRQSQEQARQSQESARQTAEGQRASAETARNQNEASRQIQESNRQDNEALRVQAENTRAANDATWNEHEQTRQENEAQRVLAEQARVEAETRRQAELDSKITYGSKWFDGSGGVHYAEEAEEANNLHATKGLTVSDDPMSFGIVGGAQKSAVSDGNASLNKLVCVDVVKNQLVNIESTFSPSNPTECTLNGSYNFTNLSPLQFVNGHKYFIYYTNSYDFDINVGYIYIPDFYGSGQHLGLSNQSNNYPSIITARETLSTHVRVTNYNDNSFTNLKIKIVLIDLTKRYGNNDVVNAICGTGTSDEQVARLLAFDPEILNDTDYDAGTLVPSKTAKLLSVGVNLLDNSTWVKGRVDDGNVGYADGTSSLTITDTGVTFTTTGGFRGVASGLTCVKGDTKYYLNHSYDGNVTYFVDAYDSKENWIGRVVLGLSTNFEFTTPQNAFYVRVSLQRSQAGTVAATNICINVFDPNINGKYYPSKRNLVTLPNYEGHGILKVVDGKVVADGTELYPDGNSKKRYGTYTFTGNEDWAERTVTETNIKYYDIGLGQAVSGSNYDLGGSKTINDFRAEQTTRSALWYLSAGRAFALAFDRLCISKELYDDRASLVGKTLVFNLKESAQEDITTPVYQSTFPVEQGGTLQFLDENDNPIAGLQGSEIFYQKNIKAFVEALGEATDWDPERIKRLGNLSFTPEYVDITLDPSPTGAYARAQVYNATFTIVISAALTGTPSGSITFQDSEVDLTNFQTKPAEAIYDMDGKKVSEEPTTADCNIASFVGRSKNGIVLWSLLHSGVNKVKVHIEEAVPLDSEGNGKIDCRASLIL